MTVKTFADFGIDVQERAGVEVATTCPECSHTRKKPKARCLSVNTVEGVWVCHHCTWAGSLRSGLDTPSRPPKRIVRPTYERPSAVPPVVLTWFAKRGIPESVVARHYISLQTVYLPQIENYVPCLTFPYFSNGEPMNIKYRALEHKAFRQVAHAEKVLYGLDDLVGQTTAIFVEGECDKLALEVAGLRHAVSVPDGAPPPGSKPSDAKFEYLQTCERELAPLKKIVLAVDNDAPGKTLEAELARRLGAERCWRVTWPDGCKDANDVLRQHGADELRRCIEHATPYPLEGVLMVTDLAADVTSLYRDGLPGGMSTGWRSLDEHYTIRPGEVTVVTGIPSHGKSQFLDALIINLARQQHWCFAVCSPENAPVQRHVAKLIEQYTGLPFRDGPSVRVPERDLPAAMDWLNAHVVFIAPEETCTIARLLDTAKGLVRRHGIRGLILDPWNEFDHRRPAGQTETEYISETLTRVRRFARAHGVHVWLVAHPQKLYRRDDGSYPVPTPYDISGSAHWRNKADNCLCVWRDVLDPSHRVDLHVQKIRFQEVGRPGVVSLTFDPKNGRYAEPSPVAPAPHWTDRDSEMEVIHDAR